MALIKKPSETVWVVVVVKGGFPTFVEVYLDKKMARQRERFYRKDIREDYDEIGIFEVKIGAQAFVSQNIIRRGGAYQVSH